MTWDQPERHTRVPGPFKGYWIGLLDTAIRIHDLSEGGCFVNSLQALTPPRSTAGLKINVPDEGWICLKAQVAYTTTRIWLRGGASWMYRRTRPIGCDGPSAAAWPVTDSQTDH